MEEHVDIERVVSLAEKYTLALAEVCDEFEDVDMMGNILAINSSIKEFFATYAAMHEPRLNAHMMLLTLKIMIDEDLRDNAMSSFSDAAENDIFRIN